MYGSNGFLSFCDNFFSNVNAEQRNKFNYYFVLRYALENLAKYPSKQGVDIIEEKKE